MAQNSDFPKLIARAQKRLAYWKESLTAKTITEEQLKNAQSLLQTYALLLSRAVKATSDQDLAETITRIQETERKLSSLFELSRLVTNRIQNVR